MYTTVSPNRGREEIGGYSGIAAMRRGREEEQDQRRGDEEEEVEEEGYSSNSGPSLRRGQMRYHRLHQFSRLPPVPERYVVTFWEQLLPFTCCRPSLENRELSPVPDIVSPTSPILSPTSPPPPPPPSSRRSSLPSPHRPTSREPSPRKRDVDEEERKEQEERRGGIGEGGASATLGRRRSRIPQPRHPGGGRLGR